MSISHHCHRHSPPTTEQHQKKKDPNRTSNSHATTTTNTAIVTTINSRLLSLRAERGRKLRPNKDDATTVSMTPTSPPCTRRGRRILVRARGRTGRWDFISMQIQMQMFLLLIVMAACLPIATKAFTVSSPTPPLPSRCLSHQTTSCFHPVQMQRRRMHPRIQSTHCSRHNQRPHAIHASIDDACDSDAFANDEIPFDDDFDTDVVEYGYDGTDIVVSHVDHQYEYGDNDVLPDAYMDDDDLLQLNGITFVPINQLSRSDSNGSSIGQDDDYGLIDDDDDDSDVDGRTFATHGNATLPRLVNGTIPVMPLKEFRQLSSNLSYFYLRDEVGLSEDIMWKITMEAGSSLTMTAANIRRKIDALRNGMALSDEDIRIIIAKQPTLLHLSAEHNIAIKIRYLQQNLNLSKKDLRMIVVKFPAILCYAIDNLERKMNFFLKTMKYSNAEYRRLLLKEPNIMGAAVQTGLRPRAVFLVREMDFPLDQVRKLCLAHPRILKMSLDNNLRPKLIFFFILTLHMQPQEVLKLLLKYPQILDYNLENHIRPMTRFFLSLDLSAHEIARMLLKYPKLTTNALPKIKRVVGYLRYQLGLEAADVRRMLYQSPQVVGLTTTNLQGKVEYLESVCPSIRKLIVGAPTVLHLSLDNNLRPKIDFLKQYLGDEELSAVLESLPPLLGYSLQNRIKPRVEAIVAANVPVTAVTVAMPLAQAKFEGWLSRKAEKLARLAEENAKQIGVDDRPPKVELSQQEEMGDSNGSRIKHWTRERR